MPFIVASEPQAHTYTERPEYLRISICDGNHVKADLSCLLQWPQGQPRISSAAYLKTVCCWQSLIKMLPLDTIHCGSSDYCYADIVIGAIGI